MFPIWKLGASTDECSELRDSDLQLSRLPSVQYLLTTLPFSRWTSVKATYNRCYWLE